MPARRNVVADAGVAAGRACRAECPLGCSPGGTSADDGISGPTPVIPRRDTVSAAVDYLARTDDTIALALVDGVMPQMLRPHVSAEIQRLRPGVPILLMSGHEAPMFSEIFDRPDHHYIAKPFVIRDLVARITRIIGQSE